jgi:hypothetical protein
LTKIKITEGGFVSGKDEYYRLEVAADILGLHPQSLQRKWRNSGHTHGIKIGRVLFFHPEDLEKFTKKTRDNEGTI